jgi:threonine dehydratase
VIEPSAAVPVAAVLSRKIDAGGPRIGVILSGGNVDLGAFFRELASKPV